jgi:hypothetical protein
MNKYNIVLTLATALLITGCASYLPKYAEGEKTENFNFPTNKEILKTFFFIGDAGYSPPGGTSTGLLALKAHLDSVDTKNDMIVFLGDNIYPDGMPPDNESVERIRSEYRIDGQLDALENFDGEILFIPGNHEWYNEGIKGLEREAEYIKSQLLKEMDSTQVENLWAPTPGCGLEIRELGEDIVLFIVDSQWFLEDWDDHPTINDDCEEIKTREAMLLEIENEIGDYPGKTKIFLMHHPIYTNGVHGGQFTLYRHLYPSPDFIPLPILGSLATLLRTTGGVSIQDLQNERYQNMAQQIAVLSREQERLLFVGGHEHSLQYIVHDSLHQVVAGSGSKSSYAVLSEDGKFAFPGQGFVRYDVFKDGSSWVSYYGGETKNPELLYQTEVFPSYEVKEYDVSKLPEKFPKTYTASVYESEEGKKEDYKSIFGDFYRKLYYIPIEARTADLDTLYGGLKIKREGGGHQTVSLKAEDSLGREWDIRRLEKSAVQFLQSTLYKRTEVANRLENTVADRIIKDFYTAAHPYIFMVIPTLSEAAGVYHTNPQIFYLPKQPALGNYNRNYGGALYMIEESPDDSWLVSDAWGNPNEDIENTAGVYSRLRRDEKYSIKEDAFIRARIFDMLIGDWDRHQDQWAWAEHETEEGNYFVPIPSDRDQAFTNFDGAFFATLRGLSGVAKQFSTYGPTIENVKWFNNAGLSLDRNLIQNSGREEWIEQAKYIQEHITDEVIEEAFTHLPPETQGEISQEVMEKLKGRRDNIVDIVERYYEYMAHLAIVTATDKDDYIEVERLPDGKTRVKVSRIKDGEVADKISELTYDGEITEELWIYGLDDDDVFEVYGEGDNLIDIKIIGGQNNDIYEIKNGEDVNIYDHKSKPNTLKTIDKKAEVELSDNYEQNLFNKDKRIFNSNVILPTIGYNPDDGFLVKIQDIYTINEFKRNPFTSRHRFGFGYYFATNGFDFSYDAQFAGVIKNYNLAIGANYTSPNYTRNFFGFGNETPNPEDEFSKDYNRVRISRIGVEAGFVNSTPFGSYFGYKASFQTVQVEDTSNRILTEEIVADGDSPFYERKYFAGLDVTYRYDSYDDVLNPTRGMDFDVSLGGKMNVNEVENTYAYFKPSIAFYNALTKNRKFVLKTMVQSHLNIGGGYEFYQAATAGGDTGFRGYREQRFSGQNSFVAGADIRYSFPKFTTAFLPFQIGIFAGGDVGRVWIDRDAIDSDKWHNDYGGGIWINSAEAVNGTFQLFNGEDGLRFSFVFGVRF